MSKSNYPKTRRATAVVKCPHCNHTGSARGLFTHVRLAHPGINEKPKTSTKITAHPYDINGLGHVKEKIHRLDRKKEQDWLTALIIPVAIGLAQKILDNMPTHQSIGYKPNSGAIGSIEPKRKRKYYGE
jgi:hypothetical protein